MKKHFIFSHVAALLLLMAVPVTVAAVNQVSYTIYYQKSPIIGTKTQSGVTYTTVKYDGLYNTGTPGFPSLPVDIIMFSVPFNASNFTVTATSVIGETINIDYPVSPIQSTPTGMNPPDTTTYSLNTFPSCLVSIEDDYLIAGENHIVAVKVMPISWMHSNGNNAIQLMESINISLSYVLNENPSNNPIVRKGVSLRDEGYAMAESMVVNPDDVRNNAFSNSPTLIRSFDYPSDLSPNDSVENPLTYIIIASPENVHPMRRLAALKMQKGINVKILTVEEAMNDSMAALYDPLYYPNYYHIFGDSAEKIRNNLRAYYVDHGCKYVLLAGSDIPFRRADGGDTDQYYCDLTGFWNTLPSNGGELSVGRLWGSQSQQFDNYTNKLFRYELNPGNGDYTYLNRELSIDFLGIGSRWIGDENLIPSNENDMYFEDSVGMTGREVIELIRDNHYGFSRGLQMGLPSGLPLTVYGEELSDTTHYIWSIDSIRIAPIMNDYETGNGFNCLNNKEYPMIFTTFYGVTMPYTPVTGYNSCINCGESFTMGKDYGGPAYIGTTDVVNFEYALPFESFFTESLKYQPIGRALTSAKWYYNSYNNEDIICCYNLLGDPSLRKWTDIPNQYSNITISRTDNSITVNGIDAANTIIGYHSNDGITGSRTTSASTITLNNVSPNSTIMLYELNHIPYLAPLVLQNTTLDKSQYVIANDVIAGSSVDTGRTNGNVTIKNGAQYEIETSGKVILSSGFKVERGAYFSVQKSTYK